MFIVGSVVQVGCTRVTLTRSRSTKAPLTSKACAGHASRRGLTVPLPGRSSASGSFLWVMVAPFACLGAWDWLLSSSGPRSPSGRFEQRRTTQVVCLAFALSFASFGRSCSRFGVGLLQRRPLLLPSPQVRATRVCPPAYAPGYVVLAGFRSSTPCRLTRE